MRACFSLYVCALLVCAIFFLDRFFCFYWGMLLKAVYNMLRKFTKPWSMGFPGCGSRRFSGCGGWFPRFPIVGSMWCRGVGLVVGRGFLVPII